VSPRTVVAGDEIDDLVAARVVPRVDAAAAGMVLHFGRCARCKDFREDSG
jgi:hypothetical protein